MKILLNALYGALLNSSFRLYDARIGQSTTLTGRSISKHMSSKVNEIITGEYTLESQARVYGDTDSVSFDTIVNTTDGEMTIEELFNSSDSYYIDKGKEYALGMNSKILTYDTINNNSTYQDINYVYRHKVSKRKFRITDYNGNYVDVTEDHSVMIERNGTIIEVKPKDIEENDLLITYVA